MMSIGVLGPVVAEAAGVEIDLGPKQQRRLLATLAMQRGRSLSTAAIAEAMWDEPPASHVVTLQGYVSGLRKALEPTREARRSGRVIVTTTTGYMLTLDAEELDADRFESAVRRAGEAFPVLAERPWQPSVPVTSEQCADARAELEAALALWRGEPYAELGTALAAQSARAGLEELRVYAVELLAAIAIALGAGAEALTRLETLSAVHPHRESLAMLKAVALVRLGRQVDALAWLRQWRERLLEDQGLDPSDALRELESAVLQQRLAPVVLADPPMQGSGDEPDPAATPWADRDPGVGRPEIRVGIVDDHPVFRMGLRGLLSCISGLNVVGEAGDPGEAEELVSRGVDVVLMDLDLAGHSGIDLTAGLIAQHEHLKVLVMTMHEESEWVAKAVAAGAHGYLIKSAQSDEIERAIRTVAAGGFVLDPGATGAVRDAILRAS